jgi:hypothetical protein
MRMAHVITKRAEQCLRIAQRAEQRAAETYDPVERVQNAITALRWRNLAQTFDVVERLGGKGD